jgi:predicted amidohydrolase
MRDIRIAAAQFEVRDADKEYNLAQVDELMERAITQAPVLQCIRALPPTGFGPIRWKYVKALHSDPAEQLRSRALDIGCILPCHTTTTAKVQDGIVGQR